MMMATDNGRMIEERSKFLQMRHPPKLLLLSQTLLFLSIACFTIPFLFLLLYSFHQNVLLVVFPNCVLWVRFPCILRSSHNKVTFQQHDWHCGVRTRLRYISWRASFQRREGTVEDQLVEVQLTRCSCYYRSIHIHILRHWVERSCLTRLNCTVVLLALSFSTSIAENVSRLQTSDVRK